MIKLITLVGIASVGMVSLDHARADEPAQVFSPPQSAEYFAALDYTSGPVRARLPRFEADLIERVLATDPHTATGALQRVYAGLFLANSYTGAREGDLTLGELRSVRPFAPDGASLTQELLAREEFAQRELFGPAAEALPDEPRVPGWVLGSVARAETLRDGAPSAATVGAMIEAARAYPIFNLFSALIVLRESPLTDAQSAALFDLVQLMVSPQSPCRDKDRPPQCGSTAIAPFARQGAGAILGDALIRHADGLLSAAGDGGELSRFASMGMILYTGLVLPPSALGTHRWPVKHVLGPRFAMGERLLVSHRPIGDFFKTPAGRAPYRCASCHTL